jgi:hypothetical protein
LALVLCALDVYRQLDALVNEFWSGGCASLHAAHTAVRVARLSCRKSAFTIADKGFLSSESSGPYAETRFFSPNTPLVHLRFTCLFRDGLDHSLIRLTRPHLPITGLYKSVIVSSYANSEVLLPQEHLLRIRTHPKPPKQPRQSPASDLTKPSATLKYHLLPSLGLVSTVKERLATLQATRVFLATDAPSMDGTQRSFSYWTLKDPEQRMDWAREVAERVLSNLDAV